MQRFRFGYAMWLAFVICACALARPALGQLSSRWSFDGNATDSVGSRNLTLVGATAFSNNTAPGFGGQSLDLSAGGNGATYDVLAGDSISGSWTVSMWVNPAVGSGGPTSTFIGTRGPTEFSFDAKFQNGDTLHGDIGTGTAWLDTSADATNIDYQANQWHHVAYSVTPTGYTAYVNGVALNSENFGPATPLLIDQNHDIAIGAARANGLGENFTGLVDEVQFFSSALTTAQVQASMAPDGHAPITTLFSTGVDGSGNQLAPGAADPHWDITASPSGPVGDATVQQNHPAWLANSADSSSSWISTVSQGTTNIAPGAYTFETTFDLTGFDPDTAVISGLVSADDAITDVILNGLSLGITTSGFADFDPISIDTGFLDGLNTLEFVLNNGGAGPNPAGFRASLVGSAQPQVVPEPGGIAIWALLGLAGVGIAWRRWSK